MFDFQILGRLETGQRKFVNISSFWSQWKNRLAKWDEWIQLFLRNETPREAETFQAGGGGEGGKVPFKRLVEHGHSEHNSISRFSGRRTCSDNRVFSLYMDGMS